VFRKLAAAASFLVLSLAALAGLAILLPGREGFSITEVPLYLGAIAGLCLLAGLWSWTVNRSRGAVALSWLVVALPILANGTVLVKLFAAEIEGISLPAKMRIENYTEAPLIWRGSDGPVGWRIEFDLIHPPGMNANVLAPELRMAPDPGSRRNRIQNAFLDRPDELSYWSAPLAIRSVAMLREPVFQKLYPSSEGNTVVLAADRIRVAYHLLPGTIAELASEDRVCVDSGTPGLPACTRDYAPDSGCVRATRPDPKTIREGTDLSVRWFAAGSYDLVADLSPLLTDTLRRRSRLQGDAAAWESMQSRLAPKGLAAAGFAICPPGLDTHNYSRVCYCR
jgi:hypothetical protein